MSSLYGDPERLLSTFITSNINPAPRVGSLTPADPNNTYDWVTNGFVKVQRIGGGGRFGVDSPRVFVETYAIGYSVAKDLANTLRAAIETQLIGYRCADGVVMNVDTTSAPSWAPYDDVKLSRFVATYQLVMHAV